MRDRLSYWETVEAIGRIVSFSFLELYISALNWSRFKWGYWEMNGALRRWMELLGKIYYANRLRLAEGFHSASACGMLPHWSFIPLVLSQSRLWMI